LFVASAVCDLTLSHRSTQLGVKKHILVDQVIPPDMHILEATAVNNLRLGSDAQPQIL
jgi:hypothetical protein